ncbi:hypothetical protein GOODEAATRI_010195 [Goodea atripinnis]|uniref:Uncharacterized protein n=1 Tax=Goodea atripinnis TaxID=208336 RepID=A0ABV0MQU3_9TELE
MSLLALTHNKLAFSIEVQETVKKPGATLATTLVNVHFVLLNGEIRPACIIGVHNCAVSGRNNLSVVIIFQLCTHSAKGQRQRGMKLTWMGLTVFCINQELSAEKSKVASVETRLSSQLSKREQEMIALQARMQASYQDHVAQTQRLNAKVKLAKLRQECAKLTKDLGEKTESLLADEQVRKGLESKLSAAEKQLSLLQVGPACGNGTFLLYIHETYSRYQVRIERLEAEVKERSAQVDTLTVQLEETQVEKNQLTQQVASINSLLEASQNKQDDDSKQLKLQLSDCQNQLDLAQKEVQAHKEELQQVRAQLGEITTRTRGEQNGPAEAEPSQVRVRGSQGTLHFLSESIRQ